MVLQNAELDASTSSLVATLLQQGLNKSQQQALASWLQERSNGASMLGEGPTAALEVSGTSSSGGGDDAASPVTRNLSGPFTAAVSHIRRGSASEAPSQGSVAAASSLKGKGEGQ